MHEEEAYNLITEILEIDRVLFEEHLGLKWEPVATDLAKREGVSFLDRRSKTPKPTSASSISSRSTAASSTTTVSEADVEADILRTIIQRIVDQGYWLVDDQLDLLLAHTRETDRNLVKIDNIFSVSQF